MSVGSKGSDTVASNHKPYITSVQVSGLVDGMEPKESGTGSNSETEHQYNRTTLRSRKKSQGDLTGGETMFSRVAKQGLLALGRGNDETHCSGSEKNALPVLAGTKSRMKRQMNIAGSKPVTSKQMREVKKPREPEGLGAFRFFFKHDKRRTRPQEECFVRSVVLDAHDLG